MNAQFRYKSLTLIVFCAYILFGSISGDVAASDGAERFPFHRIFMLLTAFIFLFNARQVLMACLKNKLLIALILYLLLTAIWANSPMETVKNFIFLLSALFISIMTNLAFSESRVVVIRWLFRVFLLLTLASIVTAHYFPNVGIKTEAGVSRWVGITPHANTLGAQSLLLVWLSTNLFFFSKSKIEKSIILSAIAAAFYAILKADSMTSFITSLVIIGLAYYYQLFWRVAFSTKLVLYTIAALSFMIVVTFYMSASEIADTTLASTGRNTTFTGRSLLWKTALKYAADQLMFGYGFDSLEQLTRKTHLKMSHLHSGYIETLVKGGIVACLLLASVFIKTLIHQLKIKSSHKHDFILLNTGLVMVLLHNVTEATILRGLTPLSIFIIFMVVSTSLIPMTNNEEAKLKGFS